MGMWLSFSYPNNDFENKHIIEVAESQTWLVAHTEVTKKISTELGTIKDKGRSIRYSWYQVMIPQRWLLWRTRQYKTAPLSDTGYSMWQCRREQLLFGTIYFGPFVCPFTFHHLVQTSWSSMEGEISCTRQSKSITAYYLK